MDVWYEPKNAWPLQEAWLTRRENIRIGLKSEFLQFPFSIFLSFRSLGDVRKYRVLFSVRKTLVSGWVGKSQLRILENYEIWKRSSASLTVMATNSMHRRRGQRPVCGGASGASQSWRKDLRCFVARTVAEGQATLLGKATVKGPWTPNAALTTKQSMRFYSSTREWPRVFFCAAQKGVVCCERRNWRWGCGCSVDACGGSIVDCRTTAYALFHCMDQRVAPPKCLWQMPVALQSEAAPRFGQWVQTRRTWKWWCRWVAQREHSFCSVMLLVWTQPFRDRRFCWQGQCHHCLATVARRLTLCCDRSETESVTSSLHLPSRHRQSSMLGQRRPNRVWIRWCRRWAPSTVTSQTDDDWCAVCGEDDGFACWEHNSCSCYPWQSPTNCHSTFAH